MRRIISSLLMVIIIVSSFSVSFANGSERKILLTENGVGKDFEVVGLKVDGKILESVDVPPLIYPLNGQGRTLVPLRMIIDSLGSKMNAEIIWDGDKNQIHVKTDKKEIILTIDRATALVNGVEKTLPDGVPAKLLAVGSNGRTMVPIRFFAEELGLSVNWDDSSRTALIDLPKVVGEKPEEGIPTENNIHITDINIQMKGTLPQIRIKTTGKAILKEFKLVNPERLVVDFNHTKFDLSNKSKLQANGTFEKSLDSWIVQSVRMSQFSNDPLTSRLVIQLKNEGEYTIAYDEKTSEYVINFINYVRSIEKETISTKEVIVVSGDYIEDYSVMQLIDPARVVIDIKGGLIHKGLSSQMNYSSRVVKSIRTSQYVDPQNPAREDIVRMVIDLQENVNANDLAIEIKENKMYVHLEGEPFAALNYEETSWTGSRLTLLGSQITNYTVSRGDQNRLQITVPKKDIELELANFEVNDHIINYMEISENEAGDQYDITLQLQESVEYKVVSEGNSMDLVLEMNNVLAKYREMLIVIDPGHGGSDPGAISATTKTHESKIVIDIATRLNKLLVDAGFRTYMTRSDDLKVELSDRVAVANSIEADLFLSIHANSSLSASPNGFETYYHPTDAAGKTLAQIFQKEVMKHLNINDRSSKSGDYYVLRNTTMPAILAETGFLSNQGDEAKLLDPNFRQQIAESMVKAIIKYFEETR